MFTTSKNSKQKDYYQSVLVCMCCCAYCPYAMRVPVQWTYVHTYRYIYQKNFAVQLASVGITHTRPNHSPQLSFSNDSTKNVANNFLID